MNHRNKKRSLDALQKEYASVIREDRIRHKASDKRLDEIRAAMDAINAERHTEETKKELAAAPVLWEQVTPPLGECKWNECKTTGIGHFRLKSTRPECQGSQCASPTEVRCEEHKNVFALGSINHVCPKLHHHEWVTWDGVSIDPYGFSVCKICGKRVPNTPPVAWLD